MIDWRRQRGGDGIVTDVGRDPLAEEDATGESGGVG